MNKQDLLLRFILGGAAVSLSYLLTILSPWKILAGIFAAFPAVMLTAVVMVGIGSGTNKAANIAKGSVYGMIGGIICVITVLFSLIMTDSWAFSITIGLITWLVSSLAISSFRDKLAKQSINEIHPSNN